ncbi:MAG: 6-carboxytetrahydropterin synthase [Bdellovibrionota bacterium]
MPTFEVFRETVWAGAHFLRYKDGSPAETMHGHNWRVRFFIKCNGRTEKDLVVDFFDMERELYKVRDRLAFKIVNEVPPFDKISPSAENLANYYLQELSKVFDSERVWVSRVMVWEMEDCCAIVESDRKS